MDNLPERPGAQRSSSPATESAEQIVPHFFGDFPVKYLASGTALSLDDVTIGILTALPREYAAVSTVLNCSTELTGGGRKYHLGVVKEKRGDWEFVVAVTLLSDMGNVSAATRVAHMLTDCKNLKDVIVCGVAGAVPTPTSPGDHVRVGDVVVSSDGVFQYDFGKQHGRKFEVNGQNYPPSPRFKEAARYLQAAESMGRRPWEKHIEFGLRTLPDTFRRPDPASDLLCEADWSTSWRAIRSTVRWLSQLLGGKPAYPPIPHPDDQMRTAERPRIFYGVIGSASSVLKDQKLRENLRRTHKVKAIEMEAVGAAHACQEGNVGYFVVRGTCDYCNEDKNKIWQDYAALAAAAYTRALLEEMNVEVFGTPQKELRIVSTAMATMPFADAETTVSDQFMDQAISETAKAASSFAELPSSDLAAPTSYTSEAIREIPRLPPYSGKDMSQPSVSALNAMGTSNLRFLNSSPSYPPVPAAESLPAASDIKEVIPDATGTESSGREQQLLIDDGERRIEQLKDLLDRWEWSGAFAAATESIDWISHYESCVPSKLAVDMYLTLARVEATKAKRSQNAINTNALELARHYLDRAKDAAKR